MKRPNKKIIAVELDQILVRTLDTFIAWHNDTYDTDITMTDIYYKNTRDMTRLFGGTNEEGCSKLREFYESNDFNDMVPLRDTDDEDYIEEVAGNGISSNGNSSNSISGQTPQLRWGALEVLQALKKRKWSLVIVTYRPQFTQAATQRFVDRYYPGLFDTIYYCNQGLSVADQLDYVPKPISVMCQEIGADYLIDDTLEHCLDCSILDMTLLLYDHHGKYTYNHIQEQKRPRYGRPTLTSTSKQLYQRSASSSSSLPKNVVRVKSWKDILDQFPMPSSPLRYCHYPRNYSAAKSTSKNCSSSSSSSRIKRPVTPSPAASPRSWTTTRKNQYANMQPEHNEHDDNNDNGDDDDEYHSTWNDAIAV